jgi:predicted DNA-binding transcriptional regulator AlpA
LEGTVVEQLLDINDVAKLTKLSVAAIRKYVLLHQIPFHKIFKAIRFRPSEIDLWINSGGKVVVKPQEGEELFLTAGEVPQSGLPEGELPEGGQNGTL